MKKNFLFLALLTVCSLFKSQSGVGINTQTPTEALDANGTVRIRTLPTNGTANAIYTTGDNTNSGATPTQTFTATRTVVLDANGVLGSVPGLPSTSNTESWLGNSGAASGNPIADHANARRINFGPLTVAFLKTTDASNSYQFWIKSSNASESYIVDERVMTTAGSSYPRFNGTITNANVWTRMGADAQNYAFGTSWHVNIWLGSVNKIYKLTVMSIFVNNTSANNRLTLNLQEL